MFKKKKGRDEIDCISTILYLSKPIKKFKKKQERSTILCRITLKCKKTNGRKELYTYGKQFK